MILQILQLLQEKMYFKSKKKIFLRIAKCPHLEAYGVVILQENQGYGQTLL